MRRSTNIGFIHRLITNRIFVATSMFEIIFIVGIISYRDVWDSLADLCDKFLCFLFSSLICDAKWQTPALFWTCRYYHFIAIHSFTIQDAPTHHPTLPPSTHHHPHNHYGQITIISCHRLGPFY